MLPRPLEHSTTRSTFTEALVLVKPTWCKQLGIATWIYIQKLGVRCVSAQDFINEYTSAVRESTNKTHASLEKFDERYRSLDLLLIDDVQSLSGAKGSQGQFFRAFEALVPHNKQLVITSDTYTRGLKDIEPRLISRLSQGLSVAIEPPEFEMRTAILLNKAKTMGVDLPDEVAAYIAKRLKSNVRELEGALQQVVAYQQFKQHHREKSRLILLSGYCVNNFKL